MAKYLVCLGILLVIFNGEAYAANERQLPPKSFLDAIFAVRKVVNEDALSKTSVPVSSEYTLRQILKGFAPGYKWKKESVNTWSISNLNLSDCDEIVFVLLKVDSKKMIVSERRMNGVPAAPDDESEFSLVRQYEQKMMYKK